MKLINDLFEILGTSVSDTGFVKTIELNSSHIIYKGHFPGHPVTPGVIQLQIVHELLENHFSQRFKLIALPQCKFLKILNPNETSRISFKIEFTRIDELLNVKASGEYELDIFLKLIAAYKFVSRPEKSL